MSIISLQGFMTAHCCLCLLFLYNQSSTLLPVFVFFKWWNPCINCTKIILDRVLDTKFGSLVKKFYGVAGVAV